jgi:hypothetical protein
MENLARSLASRPIYTHDRFNVDVLHVISRIPLSWHIDVSDPVVLRRRAMTHHAVTLGVKPCLRVECKFWLGDDGWNGISEQPTIAVQAGTFEQAKSDMEIALGKYIESLLREGRASAEHAA